MKLSDIKTLVKSVPIILAVTLYLIFKPDADEPSVTAADATALTGNELYDATYVETSEGDSITVEIDGKKEHVRLLLVNTPDMNDAETNPQPYAEEAKQFTMDVLKGAKHVQLLHDAGTPINDEGHVLAYVFVDDVSLQELLLQEGYAAVSNSTASNKTIEAQFAAIQEETKKAKVNIWSKDDYVDETTGFMNP